MMKKALCMILSMLLCMTFLASCQKTEDEAPLIIVGNEDPPITLGKENSFEIYVDGRRKPIEAYDLARVEDNGEFWVVTAFCSPEKFADKRDTMITYLESVEVQ